MLTVNITGNATGTALIRTTRAIGKVSRSGSPRRTDRPNVIATREPTIMNSHRTTRETTSSTCKAGCALSTSCVVRPK